MLQGTKFILKLHRFKFERNNFKIIKPDDSTEDNQSKFLYDQVK